LDIKSKNIKYSIGLKVVFIFLIWLSFTGLFASAVFYIMNRNTITDNTCFETESFCQEFSNYTYKTFNYTVNLRDEDYIKAGNTLPQELKEDKKNNSDPASAVNDTVESSSIEEKRKKQIEADIISFRNVKRSLDNCVNFVYLVIDQKTGKVLTNLNTPDVKDLDKTINELTSNEMYICVSENEAFASHYPFYSLVDSLRTEFEGTAFKMYAAVKMPVSEGDNFYNIITKYRKVHGLIPLFTVVAVLSIIVGLGCFIFLTITTGRKNSTEQIHLSAIDSLYNDVHAFLALVLSVGVFCFMRELFLEHAGNMILDSVGMFIFLSVILFIGLSFTLSMIRHFKNKSLIRHTLVYSIGSSIIQLIKLFFTAKIFKFSVPVLVLAYGTLNGALFAAFSNWYGSRRSMAFMAIIFLNAAALYYTVNALVSLSEIMTWVKEISKGNHDHSLNTGNMSIAFSNFASDIRNIQTGLKNAVSEAVKGERLKAELITNVSHDLKTPLTSIINYVGLLKKEAPANGKVRDYIDILDEKSARLKQLIDDLLQASKAASGNISVTLENVDLHSLVLQAVAEYSDKAAEGELDMRIKAAENLPAACADGKIMWRIMDNLLSNVIKYAQKASRVYIDIGSTDTYGTITIKNISRDALDISADQLLDRFVRGDSSRSTEGSGLGLSIAKSLAEIQGGKLDISIDGDLFKVSVFIPLSKASSVA
jgi:signal transduction histidine kinase